MCDKSDGAKEQLQQLWILGERWNGSQDAHGSGQVFARGPRWLPTAMMLAHRALARERGKLEPGMARPFDDLTLFVRWLGRYNNPWRRRYDVWA